MSSVVLLMAVCVAQLLVEPAPERVRPFFYTDEPLAVRVSGMEPGRSTLSVAIEWDTGTGDTVELGGFDSDGETPFYVTLPGEAMGLGPVSISVDGGGESGSSMAYRIHRPDPNHALPVTVTFFPWSVDTFMACLDMPFTWARIGASDPLLESAMSMLVEHSIGVRLVVDASEVMLVGELENLVQKYSANVVCWEISAGDDPALVSSLMSRLESLGVAGTVGIRVSSPAQLQADLEALGGRPYDEVIVTAESSDLNALHAYQVAADQSGFEFLTFSTEVSSGSSEVMWSANTRHLLAFVPGPVGIPAPDLNTDDGLRDLARYNLWSRFLLEYEFAGRYFAGRELDATVFRGSSREEPWMIAITSGTATQWTVPAALGEVSVLSSAINTIELDVSRSLKISPSPVFVIGRGGGVLDAALDSAVMLEVSTLLAVESYAEIIPSSVLELLNKLKSGDIDASDRPLFLEVLRSLLTLEAGLVSGDIPTERGVPVIARLSRVARWLAALAEAREVPFLEPVDTMLSQSSRLVARFMTRRQDTRNGARADQLVNAISVLASDVESLTARGYKTEAAGVAMLTEWRARALMEHAE